MTLLKQNLAKAGSSQVPAGTAEQNSLTAMSLDLILLTLPHLSDEDATSLFKLCLSSEVLESKDNGTQKRGYKILGKLLEGGKVQVDAQDVLQQLDKLLDGLAPAAKKVRLRWSFITNTKVLNVIIGSVRSAHPPLIPDTIHQSAYHPVDDPRGCPWYQGAFRESPHGSVRLGCRYGEKDV